MKPFFFALVALACVCSSQAGWDKLTWDMTADATESLYPGTTRKGDWLYLPSVDVAEVPLKVSAYFSKSDGKLEAVMLRAEDSEPAKVEGLLDLYCSKYGNPLSLERGDHGSIKARWKTEHSVIEFLFGPATATTKSVLYVNYKNPVKISGI